jgi:hypothetical protein
MPFQESILRFTSVVTSSEASLLCRIALERSWPMAAKIFAPPATLYPPSPTTRSLGPSPGQGPPPCVWMLRQPHCPSRASVDVAGKKENILYFAGLTQLFAGARTDPSCRRGTLGPLGILALLYRRATEPKDGQAQPANEAIVAGGVGAKSADQCPLSVEEQTQRRHATTVEFDPMQPFCGMKIGPNP